MRSKDYHQSLIESLKDPAEMIAYLEAVLEDGGEPELKLALTNVLEALRATNERRENSRVDPQSVLTKIEPLEDSIDQNEQRGVFGDD